MEDRNKPTDRQHERDLLAGRPDLVATSILHELRNPLGAVTVGAEVLLGLEGASVQATRVANNIHRAAQRMTALLTEFARTFRSSTSIAGKANLWDGVSAACDIAVSMAQISNVRIVIEVPRDIVVTLPLWCIERVFVNFVTNSLEAMPDGGTIVIRAEKVRTTVLIEVTDTGPGIPVEIRDRLFEPWITAGKRNGLGLGLAITREIILAGGGELWCESGEGARFMVRLPSA